MQWLTNLFPNVAVRADEFFQSIVETLIMVGITGVISFVLSLVIGVLLLTTRRGGLLAAPVFNQILGQHPAFSAVHHFVGGARADYPNHFGYRTWRPGCHIPIGGGHNAVLLPPDRISVSLS